MAGRIKAGEGMLIGNAGEHFVVAELLKQGFIAAMTPRNTPDFDILATNGNKTVKIRVKTKTGEYDLWQWSVKKDGRIFRVELSQDDFTILVNLTWDYHDMDFFILPTARLNEWLENDFKDWLAAPGKSEKPHNPTNPKRSLYYSKYSEILVSYRNHWQLLWD